jgi:hypothetical protein
MKDSLLATLYTSRGKYQTEVKLLFCECSIFYHNPEDSNTVDINIRTSGGLTLIKHGWIFSDFLVTDVRNSPPAWTHKLTLFRGDGRFLEQMVMEWGLDRPLRRR